MRETLCPPCAARIDLVAPASPDWAVCPACRDEWKHGPWARLTVRWRRLVTRLYAARDRREELIAADAAILRLAQRESAAGITWETEENDRLHAVQARLARGAAWWERIGVWHIALHRVENEPAGADQ
jgi:hypothetical protein